MVELSDIIKKAVFSLGIIGISYTSLEAQPRTGSDYIQGIKPERYQVHCLSNRGRETNMNKYKRTDRDYNCSFNSRKHLNSKEYSPQAYGNRSECVSRSAKRYNKGYNRLKR